MIDPLILCWPLLSTQNGLGQISTVHEHTFACFACVARPGGMYETCRLNVLRYSVELPRTRVLYLVVLCSWAFSNGIRFNACLLVINSLRPGQKLPTIQRHGRQIWLSQKALQSRRSLPWPAESIIDSNEMCNSGHFTLRYLAVEYTCSCCVSLTYEQAVLNLSTFDTLVGQHL